MANRSSIGGVIHTYQRYDPRRFPSPRQPPPDVVSPFFEHLLRTGGRRPLTEEELARAVRLDPSQIAGLGPSIDALRAILEERKRKILSTYETESVLQQVDTRFRESTTDVKPPRRLRERYHKAVRQQQLRELNQLWYQSEGDNSPFARQLMKVMERLGEKYEVEELDARYEFTGRKAMSIPEAIAIKEELLKIDELLQQLEEARETAQIGLIDMEALAEFAEPGDMEPLSALQQQVVDYLREIAEQQGLEQSRQGFELSPQAYRLFQGRLLERLFSEMQASRTGRHQGPIIGEGAVEMQTTKPYEFGDSIANLDIATTFSNALLRSGPGLPIRIDQRDIEVHKTRNTPKCATCVLMDMSGSMRYDGQYVNVKRMALTLDGLIRREYPGDTLHFVEVFSFAKPVPPGQIVEVMPKPVTLYDPVVQLRADMSDPDVHEHQIHPHFTNIQHGLATARLMLAGEDTPNRQVVLITDGLPTAHFEDSLLYLLYPPHPRTEEATLREGHLCAQEGITINIFLLPSWSQTEEDVRFAYRLAESTRGRVFFTAGHDLDRYVLWDYVAQRREIIA